MVSLLAGLVPAGNVLLDVAARDKRTLFEEVARLLEPAGAPGKSPVLGSLLERETLGSTGLGHGIAIPHGRVRGLREAVGAFVRATPPLAFEAPDGEPVGLIFFLLVPERATELHLQILSELVQMFSDPVMREELSVISDPAAARALICGWSAPGGT